MSVALAKSLIKDVRDVYKVNEKQADNFVEDYSSRANVIWTALNKELKFNKSKFLTKSHDERIAWVRVIDKDFQQEFPVVCVYMLFHGQFKMTSFIKLLRKLQADMQSDSTDTSGVRVNKEDRWCIRQADYVRFLILDSTNGRDVVLANSSHADAYNMLKKEFDDFRGKFDSVESSIEKDKIKFKNERLKELIKGMTEERVGSRLEDSDKQALIRRLRMLLMHQRKSNNVSELMRLANDNVSTSAVYSSVVDASTTSRKRITPTFITHTCEGVAPEVSVDTSTVEIIPSSVQDTIPEETEDEV